VPAFLTGALSRRIGDDLGFGESAAGASVASFFVGAGLLAVPMGRVTERIGPTAALRIGVTVSAACALVVAIAVSSWWQLTAVLVVAGSAVGLVDTGAARAFGDAVPASRHGLAFGAKEASVPAASLAAGLSIPFLVGALGWRSAFVAGAVLAPVVWVLVPRLPSDARPRSAGGGERHGRAPLVLFASGVAVGCGAATAASTLLVPAIADRGWEEADAGLLLAGASVCSIAVRIGAGARGDRDPQSTWTMLGTLLVAGASGALLLAATSGGVAGVIGAVAVIGCGWGWTGLAFQTAVRVGRDRPSAAAATVLTGLAVGGAVGPAAFGAVADVRSYHAAWAMASVALVVGAVAIVASRRWLEAPAPGGEPTGDAGVAAVDRPPAR